MADPVAIPKDRRFQDITGLRFGSWLVIHYAGKRGPDGYWHCRCDCGKQADVCNVNLKYGKSKSCGCQSPAAHSIRNRTHGHVLNYKPTPTYKSWLGARERCRNTNLKNYLEYGGRGIKICDRWYDSFENFIADMGVRPEGRSLERIDNNGNYEPGNCRWATRKEQANNRRLRRWWKKPVAESQSI